jgi:hypothetical protein
LQSALSAAVAARAAEPSPLFWDHFSARVKAAVAGERAPAVAWWRRPAVKLGCVAASVALVLVGVFAIPRRSAVVEAPAPAGPQLAAPASASSARPEAPRVESPGASDPAWAVIRAAASGMALDEAHAAGLNVRPGSIEGALVTLTPPERSELQRLLRAELRRGPRRTS